MIVACLLISAGAALIASALFLASEVFAAGFPVADFDGMGCCAYKTAGTSAAAASDIRTVRLSMGYPSLKGLVVFGLAIVPAYSHSWSAWRSSAGLCGRARRSPPARRR